MPNAQSHGKLILASASPRRLDLLKQINITPSLVLPADIDESSRKGEMPARLAARLALEKAQHIYKTLQNSDQASSDHYILAADTVVCCGQKSLGKPIDKAEAAKFLKQLSGGRHDVLGGIAVIAPNGQHSSKLIKTSVKFKRLTTQDIENYINSGEWDGKAGGYAIQGLAAAFIKSISGSYTNIVGLSLYETRNMLIGLGYHA
jgi:septum formation protein